MTKRKKTAPVRSFRLTDEDNKKLVALARTADRSKAWVLRILIREAWAKRNAGA